MKRNAAKIEEVQKSQEFEETLTPSQLKAIEALLSGSSLVDAAACAGVDRSTLSRWLKTDFDFQAELNRGRADIQRTYRTRLEAMVSKAMETVSKAIESGDVKASFEILKGHGLLPGKLTGYGATTLEGLKLQAKRDEASAKRSAQMDELLSQI